MSQQQQFISPREVRREIDFVEDLMGGLSSDDEYLQAMLHNQKMLGMLMLQMVEDGGDGTGPASSDPTNLSVGAVGIAAEDISNSSTGIGVFNARGSWYSVIVDAQQQIREDDIIVVNGPDNEVVPSEDVTGNNLNVGKDDDGFDGFPNIQTVGHDLDADGDLVVGPTNIERSSSILISANSTDNSAWSASVGWEDSNGNLYQTESKTDIQMDSVTQDWSRLVRKSPRVVVTFTDESGGKNNINAYVDTEV